MFITYYSIKSADYYEKLIKRTDADRMFSQHWHDYYASSNSIGRDTYLIKKYGILSTTTSTTDIDISKDFFQKYIEDPSDIWEKKSEFLWKGSPNKGRSMQQLNDIASAICCCKGNSVLNLSFEECFDLIYAHAIYQTVRGVRFEFKVGELYKRYGYTINDESIMTPLQHSILDKNGIDIFLSKGYEKKIRACLQIKPISFAMSTKYDTMADRIKCLKNQEKLDKFRTDNKDIFYPHKTMNIKYIFYDKTNDCIFSKPDGKITFELDEFMHTEGGDVGKRVSSFNLKVLTKFNF